MENALGGDNMFAGTDIVYEAVSHENRAFPARYFSGLDQNYIYTWQHAGDSTVSIAI